MNRQLSLPARSLSGHKRRQMSVKKKKKRETPVCCLDDVESISAWRPAAASGQWPVASESKCRLGGPQLTQRQTTKQNHQPAGRPAEADDFVAPHLRLMRRIRVAKRRAEQLRQSARVHSGRWLWAASGRAAGDGRVANYGGNVSALSSSGQPVVGAASTGLHWPRLAATGRLASFGAFLARAGAASGGPATPTTLLGPSTGRLLFMWHPPPPPPPPPAGQATNMCQPARLCTGQKEAGECNNLADFRAAAALSFARPPHQLPATGRK